MFEHHITVHSGDFAHFKKVCEALDISPLWIQNASGAYPRQMLCSFASKGNNLRYTKEYMRAVSRILNNTGFTVIREKIECRLGEWRERAVYHECHIKIVLSEERTEEILSFCAAHAVSPSWSLAHIIPGKKKWYLTVRDYKSSPEEARARFLGALNSAEMLFGKVKSMEMETVLLDTNVSLDQGWA